MHVFNVSLIVAASILCSASGFADDLPKELLLQCEGKSMMFLMEGSKTTDIKSDTFKGLQLRLKDRTIINTEVNVVYGNDCSLKDGKIGCELDETIYSTEFSSTEKRHIWVSLVKDTGELKLSIETWNFKGKSTVGTAYLSSRVQRSGLCRTVGKPLF